jgi:hypothetical protein
LAPLSSLVDYHIGKGRDIAGIAVEVLYFVRDDVIDRFIGYGNHIVLVKDIALQFRIDGSSVIAVIRRSAFIQKIVDVGIVGRKNPSLRVSKSDRACPGSPVE